MNLKLKCFLEGIDPLLSAVEIPETIAKAIFVGYIGQNPIQVIGEFRHQDGMAKCSSLCFYDSVVDGLFLLSGSPILIEQYDGPENTTLEIAAENVRKYTQDCVDHRCTIPDCAAFGGHVHVATVTTDGFSWVIPPIEG